VPAMRRVVILSLVFAAAACSKSDSSKHTGTSPPVKSAAGEGARAPSGAGPTADQGEIAAPGAVDNEFHVEATGVTGAAGAETVARVVVRPGKGFHMNKDYPTKLSLELPAGVTSAKAVLMPADAETFDDNQLAFAVKLTPAAAGDYSIPATLKFAVCTDSTCNPKKQAIALSLKAQ
jgi:hypothetical protein